MFIQVKDQLQRIESALGIQNPQHSIQQLNTEQEVVEFEERLKSRETWVSMAS